MAYVGGKAKTYQHITNILNNECFDNFDYIEPFIGYGHILRRIVNKKSYKASDNNPLLITLLKHVQKSNKYPHISEKEYYELKSQNTTKTNILKKSFAAFTYSYNGKEFGGYTNIVGERNYPKERKKYYNLLRENESFNKTKIYLKDYDDYSVKNKLIYCDPPYLKTTGYATSTDFDHDKFWNVMRKWSKNNYVFISEYKAPDDFVAISSNKKHSTLSGKGSTSLRTEKLFVHKNFLKNKLYLCLKSKKRSKSKKKSKKFTN
jgi:DNA adenine methylase